MSATPGRRELVINTGPLLGLIAAGHLDVLPKVFGRVIVPSEVVQEIEAGGSVNFGRDEFRAAGGFDRRKVPTPVPVFLRGALDPGEAAVIALASAERIATVCIDESLGRRMARLHGLAVTGSLGVLVRAKQSGLPVLLRPAIERMKNRGIWLTDGVISESLRLAGE